jgi:hypothetical protein
MTKSEYRQLQKENALKFWANYKEAHKRMAQLKDFKVKALDGKYVTISLEKSRTSELNCAKIMGLKHPVIYARLKEKK